MKYFMTSLKPAFMTLLLLTVLLGVVYPVFIWAIGQLMFQKNAAGSLLYFENGKILGSSLIAQKCTAPQYFHPRPSNAGSRGYDAVHSGASNLGPTSQKLIDSLKERAVAFRIENNLSADTMIPADAVTTSGSGLDPHISLANALLQAPRVAQARNLSLAIVEHLIKDHIEECSWGFLGEDRIHVLQLNVALDQISSSTLQIK